MGRPPPPPEYFELRNRAVDRATWAHTQALVAGIPDPSVLPPPWASQVALTLFERLAPGVALGPWVRVDRLDHGRAYNWGEDRCRLSKGGGVLVADHCFGALPGDGVDVVAHVMPDPHARVLFHEGTDYSQYNSPVLISADRAERCAELVASVGAILKDLGFGTLRPVEVPLHTRRVH